MRRWNSNDDELVTLIETLGTPSHGQGDSFLRVLNQHLQDSNRIVDGCILVIEFTIEGEHSVLDLSATNGQTLSWDETIFAAFGVGSM